MTKISRGVGRRNQLEFLLALTPPGAPLFLREAERAICGSDPRTIAARPSLAPSLQPRTNPWIGAGGRVRSKWRAPVKAKPSYAEAANRQFRRTGLGCCVDFQWGWGVMPSERARDCSTLGLFGNLLACCQETEGKTE